MSKTRILAENHFVTRIKDDILYQSVRELDLPDDKDAHIIKDEIIFLTGKAAVENKLNEEELRRVAVFIVEGNRTIELITIIKNGVLLQ